MNAISTVPFVGNGERLSRAATREDQLKASCKAFEALMVKRMLNAMRRTVSSEKSQAQKDFFENRLFDNYAQKISETANLGLANMLYESLSHFVESSEKEG